MAERRARLPASWWLVAAITPPLRAAVAFFAVPVGEPWRRSCDHCAHPLAYPWRSTAFLPSARCPSCRERVGAPAGSVELAALAAGIVLYVSHRAGWELAAYVWFAGLGVMLASVDGVVRRLPNVLTGLTAGGLLAALGVVALVEDRGADWIRGTLAGVLVTAVFGLVALVRPRMMGWGDVKLAFSTGLVTGWVSWTAVYAGVWLAFLLAAVWALARRRHRGDQVILGPGLVAGALIAASLLP
ncbi:leader peptidase (prepilin peptidase) / N-methyltransferase [Asanoa hainanensis]|uniref:Leader peptidase (Prepilin peptidase) / N-methyltransferase n=2 Tax=Micromonosporaceae TaxID=28056 RepID=A0A239PGJ2_9ACTN|nr:leader peptidase (prepilin peptidase) / N-methyltransferase [Asanoa hainanensis]